jgi:hypothetical protein
MVKKKSTSMDEFEIPNGCVLGPVEEWVEPGASLWGESEFLPRVPDLDEIRDAVDDAGILFKPPAPGSKEEKIEIEELIDLSQLRDDPHALYSSERGRERRAISRFLQLRPQPYGAAHNMDVPPTEPAVRTGRELARWFESETPGLAERLALNYLLPRSGFKPPRQARVWCALDCAIYGALLGAWWYKWQDPRTKCRHRPVQADPRVSVLYNFEANATFSGDGELRKKPSPSPGTPRHPAFPAGHSTVAGAGLGILSYFFPDLTSEFEDMADNAGMARLWAGIHFRSDHIFGINLGKVIAGLVVARLVKDGVDKK